MYLAVGRLSVVSLVYQENSMPFGKGFADGQPVIRRSVEAMNDDQGRAIAKFSVKEFHGEYLLLSLFRLEGFQVLLLQLY